MEASELISVIYWILIVVLFIFLFYLKYDLNNIRIYYTNHDWFCSIICFLVKVSFNIIINSL